MIKHTKESIKQLLLTNDRAVVRAITALYNFQTMDEQRIGDTRHYNRMGFNSSDAKFLSNLAMHIEEGIGINRHEGEEARRRLMKYAGQLARIANEEQQNPSAV